MLLRKTATGDLRRQCLPFGASIATFSHWKLRWEGGHLVLPGRRCIVVVQSPSRVSWRRLACSLGRAGAFLDISRPGVSAIATTGGCDLTFPSGFLGIAIALEDAARSRTGSNGGLLGGLGSVSEG